MSNVGEFKEKVKTKSKNFVRKILIWAILIALGAGGLSILLPEWSVKALAVTSLALLAALYIFFKTASLFFKLALIIIAIAIIVMLTM